MVNHVIPRKFRHNKTCNWPLQIKFHYIKIESSTLLDLSLKEDERFFEADTGEFYLFV